MKEKCKTKRLSVHVPEETYQFIEEEAKKRGMNFSSAINLILYKWKRRLSEKDLP